MSDEANYRRSNHSVSLLRFHLVFVTKYRRERFNNEMLDRIPSIMTKIANEIDVVVLECDGESDHVHLIVEIPPKVSISDVVFRLKGGSSHELRSAYPQLRSSRVLWSPSYFAASVGGAPMEIIRKYVQNQRE